VKKGVQVGKGEKRGVLFRSVTSGVTLSTFPAVESKKGSLRYTVPDEISGRRGDSTYQEGKNGEAERERAREGELKRKGHKSRRAHQFTAGGIFGKTEQLVR